ncbi:hypothetical protein PMIN06_006467 [Paraphaeosphaeria minitans]
MCAHFKRKHGAHKHIQTSLVLSGPEAPSTVLLALSGPQEAAKTSEEREFWTRCFSWSGGGASVCVDHHHGLEVRGMMVSLSVSPFPSRGLEARGDLRKQRNAAKPSSRRSRC